MPAERSRRPNYEKQLRSPATDVSGDSAPGHSLDHSDHEFRCQPTLSTIVTGSVRHSTTASSNEPTSPQVEARSTPKSKRIGIGVASQRKKVSRACDLCKGRKVRCSGTLPCSRCTSQQLQCQYNADHRRGNPASPARAQVPSPSCTGPAANPIGGNHIQPTDVLPQTDLPSSKVLLPPRNLPALAQFQSSRNSQEPEETLFEGHYIGPTSGIAFLHRAQRRLKHDSAIATLSDGNGTGFKTTVFNFGDGPVPALSTSSPSSFAFPPKETAISLVERYFDFAIPTYRFLHRPTVEEWLDTLYLEQDIASSDTSPLSDGKAAVILLILATATLYRGDSPGTLHDGEVNDYELSGIFFAAAEVRLHQELGPARLESVQARLAQCLYLLGSSRINQAWYIFGTITQLILALGLHRKRHIHSYSTLSSLVEVESRKRVFWSAYTLDRYISVILGRPRAFRDEDIDQDLPERLNDSDFKDAGMPLKLKRTQCLHDAPLFHAKLAQIIGGVSTDLYPTNKQPNIPLIESAEKHTAEILEWRDSLPAFLNPDKVDPAVLMPIFNRQSTVLILAFAHALILANRPSLLSSFADLKRRQILPSKQKEESVKVCIDAACLVVDTVNEFIKEGKMYRTFWFTHYISFCAIATLYVYTIQQSTSRSLDSTSMNPLNVALDEEFGHYFKAAEQCHHRISSWTNKTSPFRRYNIILDELKRDVIYHLRKHHLVPANGEAQRVLASSQQLLSGSHPSRIEPAYTNTTTPTTVPQSRSIITNIASDTNVASDDVTEQFGALDSTAQGFTTDQEMIDLFSQPILSDPLIDVNFFGPEGELVGWSEFDSWAIGGPDVYDNIMENL